MCLPGVLDAQLSDLEIQLLPGPGWGIVEGLLQKTPERRKLANFTKISEKLRLNIGYCHEHFGETHDELQLSGLPLSDQNTHLAAHPPFARS